MINELFSDFNTTKEEVFWNTLLPFTLNTAFDEFISKNPNNPINKRFAKANAEIEAINTNNQELSACLNKNAGIVNELIDYKKEQAKKLLQIKSEIERLKSEASELGITLDTAEECFEI